MPLQFHWQTTSFTSSTSISESHAFAGLAIIGAGVAMQGFESHYLNGNHHAIATRLAEISQVWFEGDTVHYTVSFRFDATSGNICNGSITALIIAETL